MDRPLHMEIDPDLGTGQPVSIVDPASGDTLGSYATVVDAYHAKALMEDGTNGIGEGDSGIRTNLNPGGIGQSPVLTGITTPTYGQGTDQAYTAFDDVPPEEAINHNVPRW